MKVKWDCILDVFWLLVGSVFFVGCGKERAVEPDRGATSSPATQTMANSEAMVPVEASAASSVCRECHEDQFQSYLLTDHSRSMRKPDSSNIPVAEVSHRPSHRSYHVYQAAGEARHRQSVSLPVAGGPQGGTLAQVPIGDFPIAWIMGSGRFVESFILRDGDYLLQSPLGRYIKPQTYDMCPGYEGADHRGFTRVVRAECLFCHVGSLHDDNDQQPVINEFAIGCQRCHGEGTQHMNHHQNSGDKQSEDVGEDSSAESPYKETIINPAKLARRESESICAQCHLQGDYVVYQPGRKLWDFRPGEDFQMTRMTYIDERDSQSADQDFVGHFDQLWKSKCYVGSDSMTCISCHDPHHTPQPDHVESVQRDQCLQCHENESCGVSLADRIRTQGNRCVDCHMPKMPSDVIHAPTTNHEIGIYDANKVIKSSIRSVDVAVDPIRRIAPPGDTLDATRSDLLAECNWLIDYVEATGGHDRQADISRIKSRLVAHLKRQPTDTVVQTRLAALMFQEILHRLSPSEDDLPWKTVQQLAAQVLPLLPASSRDRLIALKILAESYDETNDIAKATQYYRQLTRERRSARDHYNLGLLLGKQRDSAGADSALREAIRINGAYQNPYRSLSILYRSIDPTFSRQMQVIADSLQQLSTMGDSRIPSQLD